MMKGAPELGDANKHELGDLDITFGATLCYYQFKDIILGSWENKFP